MDQAKHSRQYNYHWLNYERAGLVICYDYLKNHIFFVSVIRSFVPGQKLLKGDFGNSSGLNYLLSIMYGSKCSWISHPKILLFWEFNKIWFSFTFISSMTSDIFLRFKAIPRLDEVASLSSIFSINDKLEELISFQNS